jgi:hypothetical protein
MRKIGKKRSQAENRYVEDIAAPAHKKKLSVHQS